MASGGVEDEELANAKTFLTGSYALRFDSNAKIASELLGIQQEELGIDYLIRRNDLINAVTKADIARVAARLLTSQAPIVAIVGDPDMSEAPLPPPRTPNPDAAPTRPSEMGMH
jgi:zinc protease